jgi:hypothetical protein
MVLLGASPQPSARDNGHSCPKTNEISMPYIVTGLSLTGCDL